MAYTIGVGVLFEEEFNNAIRRIELALLGAVDSNNGLRQPPHVTIKRPCHINGDTDIDHAMALVKNFAKDTDSFMVKFGAVGKFGDSVLYLSVQENQLLVRLHQSLVESFESRFGNTTGAFEGDKVIFHTTLAMGLTLEELEKAKVVADKLVSDAPREATATKLGLFLGMDDDTNWIIIGEWALRSKCTKI